MAVNSASNIACNNDCAKLGWHGIQEFNMVTKEEQKQVLAQVVENVISVLKIAIGSNYFMCKVSN